WMADTLWNQWRRLGVAGEILAEHHTSDLWRRLAQFPVEGNLPLVIKAALRSSHTVEFVQLISRIDPKASIQAHAGNGIVIARMAEFGTGGLSNLLGGQLQPAATECGGSVRVLSCATPGDLTRQCWWGSLGDAASVMEEIKRRFDPKRLLNRGRFV